MKFMESLAFGILGGIAIGSLLFFILFGFLDAFVLHIEPTYALMVFYAITIAGTATALYLLFAAKIKKQ